MTTPFDRRPIVVAITGPNGAGKTTFHGAHLADTGLRYVNTDALAAELAIESMAAAGVADAIRRALVAHGESFIFETVFSDPVGDKLAFLEAAAAAGYSVVLCFVGVSGPDVCAQRVSMRVSQGGHDVPDDRLISRYPRTLTNLSQAIRRLPYVLVFDNDDLARPFRRVGAFEDGITTHLADDRPAWLDAVLPSAD